MATTEFLRGGATEREKSTEPIRPSSYLVPKISSAVPILRGLLHLIRFEDIPPRLSDAMAPYAQVAFIPAKALQFKPEIYDSYGVGRETAVRQNGKEKRP